MDVVEGRVPTPLVVSGSEGGTLLWNSPWLETEFGFSDILTEFVILMSCFVVLMNSSDNCRDEML